MINLKSPNTLSRVIFNLIAISNPIIKAWYSATLLKLFFVRMNAWSKTYSSKVTRITLALTPSFRVAPSKNNFQGLGISMNNMSLSERSSENSQSSNTGWLARKSANACPSTVFWGTYVISNSYNRRAHFFVLPLRMDLDMRYLMGFVQEIRQTEWVCR